MSHTTSPPAPETGDLPLLPLPPTSQYINRLTPEILNLLTPALKRGDFMTSWVHATGDDAHFSLERRGTGVHVHVRLAVPHLEDDLRRESGAGTAPLTAHQVQALTQARSAAATVPCEVPASLHPVDQKDLLETALNDAYTLAARQAHQARHAALEALRPTSRTLN